mgnify:CR=1 FL=1
MNISFRSALLALAFSFTVAAGVTGASLSGVTKETSLDDACAHADWPLIPDQCLEGATGRDVRIVKTRPSATEIMASPVATALN